MVCTAGDPGKGSLWPGQVVVAQFLGQLLISLGGTAPQTAPGRRSAGPPPSVPAISRPSSWRLSRLPGRRVVLAGFFSAGAWAADSLLAALAACLARFPPGPPGFPPQQRASRSAAQTLAPEHACREIAGWDRSTGTPAPAGQSSPRTPGRASFRCLRRRPRPECRPRCGTARRICRPGTACARSPPPRGWALAAG